MKLSKILTIIFIIILVILGGNYIKNALLRRTASTISTQTADIMVAAIKKTDFAQGATKNVNIPFSTNLPKGLSLSMNQGIIEVQSGKENEITGQIIYTGQETITETITAEGYEIIKFVQPDQAPEKRVLVIPSNVTFSEVNVGIGGGVFKIDMQGAKIDALNLGMGAGDTEITLSNNYSTIMNLSNGNGDINLRIPENVGFKVIISEDTVISGVDLKKDSEKNYYTSSNYESSTVTAELTIENTNQVNITAF